MALVDIPHVIDAGVDPEFVVLQDGSIDYYVIVLTDLELDSKHHAYDKVAVDKLLADLSHHVLSNPHHAGKLRVRTKR